MGASLGACDDQGKAQSGGLDERQFKVTTITIEQRRLDRLTELTGEVVSDDTLVLSSRISGVLTDVTVNIGDEVVTGQVLARIDSARVEGDIRSAQANLGVTKAELANAQNEFNRAQTLLKKNAGTQRTFDTAKASLDVARANVNRAQAVLDTAMAEQQYVNLASPSSYVVVERMLDPGEMAGPGLPILRLASIDNVVFESSLPSTLFSTVNEGDDIIVRLDGASKDLPGTIARIVPVADPITRTHTIRIAFQQSTDIFPGQYGRLLVPYKTTGALTVPSSVLVNRAGVVGGFVVSKNQASFRTIRTGTRFGEWYEILSGLKGGERLVVNPPKNLRNGDMIVDVTSN